MPPVIVAKDLYKCYPGFPPVLRGVNIDVQPGEMVAIMGPSGCGKSTMLHILGMLHSPDSGQLSILNQDVLKLNSDETAAFRRGNMGFVMQASNLFEHSTVFENVEFPLIYENVPPQERWERVIRALELVRLSSRVHYRSNRLSGGEQQRVAIARAMVNNPRILLADEPTGALDARTSAVIMENFRSLCHTGGVAMVMVTHDPKMAEYCDSIYTLEEGQLRCKKHEPPKVSATSAANFLNPPEPIVRGAIIAWRFPDPANYAVPELARRLHGQRLLSRIYALTENGFLAGQGNYSLPLVVRHASFWKRFFGDSAILTKYQKEIAALKQARAGSPLSRGAVNCGSILASWAQADNAQFLFAAGADNVAASTFIAGKILSLPFAFAVRPEDIARLGPDCAQRSRDAAFITCSTSALAKAFHKIVPDLPSDKILIVPNPPRFIGADEEKEQGPAGHTEKPVNILAMPPRTGRKYFDILIQTASLLKKRGLNFKIAAMGKPGFWLRLKLAFGGLAKFIHFTGINAGDREAEQFRNADIFIAWPPAGPGLDLAMPWPVCEGMAFGLPIIALGISEGMAPLSPGKNCLAAEDVPRLAENIKKLADDPKMAANLGQAAKKDINAMLDTASVTRQLTDKIVMAAAKTENKKDASDANGL